MTIDLKQLAERSNTTGIMTADRYVKAFADCYGGAESALCPAKLMEIDGDQFAKMVKASEDRLTYAEVEAHKIKIADGDLMTKARELVGDERADIVEKALAVFENVMSVTGEDRDGDMMFTAKNGEYAGMVVDDNMPLLWMHMQVNPIGAFLGKTLHDDTILKGLFAVAATKLGEDMVTLAEVGGIRTSIGFNAHEGAVSPRKTATVNGRKKVLSWAVKGCNVLEDSCVSVPSCEGAVIETLHRNKLHDEYVKHWAKSISDGRPLIVPGIDIDEDGGGLRTKDTTVDSSKGNGGGETGKGETGKGETGKDGKKKKPKKKPGDAENTNSGDTDDNSDPNNKTLAERLILKGFTPEQAKGFSDDQAELLLSDRVSITPADDNDQPSLVSKSFETVLTHKMYGMNDHFLPGSYEWVCYRLDRAAKTFLVGQGVMDADDYGAGIVATFADEAILCCGPWESKSCFRATYSMGENGVPVFSGDAVEVEIKAAVVEKWFGLMQKRLSVVTPEPVEPTAIELARALCAKTIASDDETLADALNMASHAAEVFTDHDEATLYGELLTAD